MSGNSYPFDVPADISATDSTYHPPSGRVTLSSDPLRTLNDYPYMYRSNWQCYDCGVHPSSRASFQFLRYFS